MLHSRLALAPSDKSMACRQAPSLPLSESQRSGMTQLLELALRYQHALDGLSESNSAAASSAGHALCTALSFAGADRGERSKNVKQLEPIILRTTLATSIVTYLEHIPWGKVTVQTLMQPQGTPVSEAILCGTLLDMLVAYTLDAESASNCSRSLGALLLRQVRVFLK